MDYLSLAIGDAKKYNGKFLSITCDNLKVQCLWECQNGHQFIKSYSAVKRGFWCQYCSGKKLTIEQVKEIATNKGGELLSDVFTTKNKKIKWKCKNNHIFFMSVETVNTGHWCRECSGYSILTLDTFKKLAKLKNGQCLSDIYVNSISKLKWQCKEGHVWESIPANVLYKHKWCPYCSGNAKYSLDIINDHIKLRGKCLSLKYLGAKRLHKFQCNKGHTWQASVTKIMGGRWCIYCVESYPERVTRIIFETFFGKKFVKYKPKWLKNKKGYQLEIDGFCKKLNIAFEHNGAQHYEKNSFFKSENIQQNDLIKHEKCSDHNIKLFEINQLFKITKLNDVLNMLTNYCEQNNIKIKNKNITMNFIKNNLTY